MESIEGKRVLIINGSPNGEEGNTEIVIKPFVEGIESTGGIVTRLYTKDLRINPCCGTCYCWKNRGNCCRKDDMQKVHEALNNADILVLASPVYVGGLTGPLKNLLDRFLVRASPYIVNKNGHNSHNANRAINSNSIKKIMLVSNCGFHELDNFDAILTHARLIAELFHCEFAGALLRPHGPAMRFLPKKLISKVLSAAKMAGQELIQIGRISESTAQNVSKELIDKRKYVLAVNAHWGKMKVKSFFSSISFSEKYPPISTVEV